MRTILVIDDSALFLETLAMLLEQHNFNVVSTQEPERALGLCREVNFDVILCDLCMGQNDQALGTSLTAGMDTIWQLVDKHPGIPVIAMSGNLERQDLGKMKKLGVAGAIQKPFSDDSLVRELSAVIGSASKKDSSAQ